jgi:hypothetical protein
MVAYRDELGFGIEQEPQKFIADIAGFENRLARGPAAWALMSPATWKDLRTRDCP